MSKPQGRLIWILFLATVFVAQAFAQGGATGAITGTVEDNSGAIIANAEVRITNQDTEVLERTRQIGADGVFTAPLLPGGTIFGPSPCRLRPESTFATLMFASPKPRASSPN